jgi:outer membrane lipoprotein-sorting protein
MLSPRCLRVASAISAGFLFTDLSGASLAATPFPKPTAAYTATQTIETEGETIKSKVFRDGFKMRTEMEENGTMILDTDNSRMLMIMPGMPMAMAMPLDPSQDWDQPGALDHCEVTKGGGDTIGGEATTLYAIDCPANGTQPPWKGDIAITADGIPMRMDMENIEGGKKVPVKIVLTDVKRAPQPASLFTLPAGVQVQTMPAMPAMPGGR